MKRTATLLAATLLIATASAHTAAPPRGHEVRLLHDCNDDYYGGDALGSQEGHELHALDLYEAWDAAMGNVVVFRLTLAGEGPSSISLDLKAGSSSKSYTWTTQGSAWSGTFDKVEGPFQATKADGSDDGERYVLHGIVKQSKLGATGVKLTDYSAQSRVGGEEADNMPGYDGGLTGSCSDEFQRPDYTLAGPVQYAALDLEKSHITVKPGEEVFLQVTASNKVRDQAQRITIMPSTANGVEVRMHNPTSNAYDTELSFDLNKKGSAGDSKLGHVAVTGTQPGASGTIEVTLTTNLGGRLVKAFTYEVAQSAPSATPSNTPGPGSESDPDNDANEAPAVGGLAMVGLLALAFTRRR